MAFLVDQFEALSAYDLIDLISAGHVWPVGADGAFR